MDVINIGILSEIVIPAPTIEEQEKLLIFYRKNTQKFDELMSKANCQIDLLHERRTALISAAVTGKIDVRNWQPAQTEIPRKASA
jgi:type I restriction enzyme S subunit